MKLRVTIDTMEAETTNSVDRIRYSPTEVFQQIVETDTPIDLIADIAGVVNGLLETQQK